MPKTRITLSIRVAALPFPDHSGCRQFSEGLAAVQKGNKWGYIDKRGQFVIRAQFDNALTFKDGVAAVIVDEKEGLIDRNGNTIIERQFKEVSYFFNSPLATVSISDQEWGYVNRAGKFVWRAPQSERPIYFEHDPLEGITKEEIEASCK